MQARDCTGGGLSAALSAGGAQDACGGCGGGAVVGVVVVGLGAGQDRVPVGGGTVELELTQILGMDWFMVL